MGKNTVLVYTCTALIIREINACNVPTYDEFIVVIFNDVCLWSRDTNSSKPSHTDTVLTTLSYLERTLTELGMKT